MRHRFSPLTIAAALVGASIGVAFLLPMPAAAQTVPRTYPVRDFFAKPEKGYFQLSDDGRLLGFTQPVSVNGGPRRLNVHVQPIRGGRPVGEPRRLTAETARDIRAYDWKGSDRILYTKDFGGDENYHVVAVDVRTGRVTDLTPGDKVRAEIVDLLPDDPHHLLVAHNRRDPAASDVVRIDLRSGREVLVARNPGDIIDWRTDHAGRLRLAVRSEGLKISVLIRPDEKSEFKPIITTDYRSEVDVPFFAADNRRLYAISNRGRDKKALVLIDPTRPEVEELVFAHPEVDVQDAEWSRRRGRLVNVSYLTDRIEFKHFDPVDERLMARIRARVPGMEISLQGRTRAEDQVIVAAASDRTPGTRYLYDARSGALTALAELNPRLAPADMAEMKPIAYPSRDGLTIPGYLTLPVGREAKNLPCVINPHGGPWARNRWGFNPEVQFLANRGYCVLQMNFRGSTGYGRKFWEASFGQWGLTMQDDITDGVQWLIRQGVADPRRVAIYGASYGGYATLAGVAFTPDLYAAAVDYVGVSNLFTFLDTIPPYWKPYLTRFHDMIGHPERDKERLERTSPVLHADRIRTPLFVVQGANDPRVNKAESDQMVQALRRRGIDVPYLVKDDEGHGFRNEENQFEFYAAMEAFLARHLKP